MTPEEARNQLKHLFLHAKFAEGERLAREVRAEALRQNDQELASDSAFRLGQFCFEQLRYQDAWDAFADALTDRSELYGSDHVRTTQARAWLASVSWSLQRSAETRALLERAISAISAGGRASASDEPLIFADTLKAIGFAESRLNRTDSALEHLRQSLELVERAAGVEELEVASACVILGTVEQQAKHLDRAEVLFKRALEIRLRYLGEDNPLVAYCRNHVGITKLFQGNTKEARGFVEASIEGLETNLADKRLVASSMVTRGVIAASEEEHTKAIDTLERALTTKEGAGSDTVDVAQTLLMLGLMQLGFEKPELAEPHLRRAVKILLPFHQTQLDPLFKSFNNTLVALNTQRKYKEVIAFAEGVLEKVQNDPLVDPNFLGAVLTGLSTGYYGLGKAAKAEKLLRRALGVVQSRLGANARELGPILHNLAQLLEGMGRRAEARTYQLRADEILAQEN